MQLHYHRVQPFQFYMCSEFESGYQLIDQPFTSL